MSALSVKRTLATVGLTAVETAVVKATFDDDEPPKNKHIRAICDYVELELAGSGYVTSHNNMTLVEMFRKRVNRMSNSSLTWKVAIKSLITIHLLLRQCDNAFIDEFTQYGQSHHRVFDLTNRYNDSTNSNSIVHSTFTRKYSRYLLEKLVVYQAIDFNVERKLGPNNKDFFADFDINSLGKILPLIMKQLDCVLEVIPQLETTSFNIHPLEKSAMLLLIKDSIKIYSGIQLILWQLICNLEKLNKTQAKWASKTYNSYFDLNTQYQSWFLAVVKLGIVNHQFAPKFNTLPETLCEKLKQYICDQDNIPKKKKKKNKRKKKAEQVVAEEEELKEANESIEVNETNESNARNANNTNNECDLLGVQDLLNTQNTTTQSQNPGNWYNEFNDGADDWWNNKTTTTQTETPQFGTFMDDLNNNNNHMHNTAISGGTARVLKKNPHTKSEDPFLDLLNFN